MRFVAGDADTEGMARREVAHREVVPVEAPVEEIVAEIDYLRVAHGNPEIAKLWRLHVARPSVYTESDLIMAYQWLCRSVARKAMGMMFHQVGAVVDREDLVSIANIGLMGAFERYKINTAAAFATFARRRMWGECVDEMRRLSLVKRRQYQQMKEAGTLPRIHNFSQLGEGHGDNTPRRRYSDWENWEDRVLAEETTDEIADREATEELWEALEKALREIKFSDRDRAMFELYYFAGMPQLAIGERYSVTEARVSQVLTVMRRRLLSYVRQEVDWVR